MNKHILLFAAMASLLACRQQNKDQQKGFVDVNGIDSTTKPGDNFFRYVNGKWDDTARIADDQSGVGSYSFLNIPQKQLLQNILDSVSQGTHAPGSIDQKVVIFMLQGWIQLRSINAPTNPFNRSSHASMPSPM